MQSKTRQEHHLYEQLLAIYSPQQVRYVLTKLNQRLIPSESKGRELHHSDVMLTAYADHVAYNGQPALAGLHKFISEWLPESINTVHILPFYPFTSDDGYAVVDFQSVNRQFGNWSDVHDLAQDFNLMFDVPLNHVSASHPWFQEFLKGNPHYQDYFIVMPPDTNVSEVVRPRSHPLLTPFTTSSGETLYVWTTFSPDQVDLNYQNPDVLLEMIDIILYYVARGARFIRLDAVGFLWKDPKHPSIHMPQAHQIVQILRSVLDSVAPFVHLVTETNVPHRENVSYFGDGYNEAQLVYNFSLPPLLLHALYTTQVEVLADWMQQLQTPSPDTHFLNFTASHDGIGLRPVDGILDNRNLALLTKETQRRGGLISYRELSSGELAPYELNITYFDATRERPYSSSRVDHDRFLLTQSVMLTMAGVPAVYFSSLFGAQGWHAGVEQHGAKRAVNRQKYVFTSDGAQLQFTQQEHDDFHMQTIFQRFRQLLGVRRQEPAFHPRSQQHVRSYAESVLIIERTPEQTEDKIIAVHNFASQPRRMPLPPGVWRERLTGATYEQHIVLEGYSLYWLKLDTAES